MGKKKSNSANAARALESTVSPILEINYSDPLFALAAHPTQPILVSGLATGHLYCAQYDDNVLESSQQVHREQNELAEREAFARGKISAVTKSVSQTKHKWWTCIDNHAALPQGATIAPATPVVNLWKTKRHKGSCRSIIFDPLPQSVGQNIYSVGTDHVIKKADTETGKVVSKAEVKFGGNGTDAITKLCHSTSHPLLLAGTESGHVLVYDSSNLANKVKFRVDKVHDDSINHMLAMPEVSAYHYLTLGSTTLAHIDIRKGIITQSDDQEDELLSMCHATDQLTQNKNDTVLVSHGEGIVTIWKNSKNRLADQLSRIKVNQGASIDAIVPTMNMDDEELRTSVWCGDSEGLLHRINYKMGKVVETRVHSASTRKHGAADEVGILDIDFNYRLISAGMDGLKIWSNEGHHDVSGSDGASDCDSDSESDDGSDGTESGSGSGESGIGSGSGSYSDTASGSDVDSSDDGSGADEDGSGDDKSLAASVLPTLVRKKRLVVPIEASKPKPKKRVINLNGTTEPAEPAEPNAKKLKAKQMTTKQLRNLQKHEHGIRRFDDL
ncbi:WD repeat-containing protein JIP5 [[Candida] zeylanoides]